MCSSKNPCISAHEEGKEASMPGRGQGSFEQIQGSLPLAELEGKANTTPNLKHTSNNPSFFPFYPTQISSFSSSEMSPKGHGYFLPNQPHFHGNGQRPDAIITTEKYLYVQFFSH